MGTENDEVAAAARGTAATRSNAPNHGDLVSKLPAGDLGTFDELYRRHAGAVHLAVRDNVHAHESVADVVQEVFLRALERLDTLRDAERFRPWLLSIARHAAIDHRRARQRVTMVPESGESYPD